MAPKTSRSSTGLSENVAGFFSYLLWFITGFVFYWEEKKSQFVRFHALQSIITFIPISIILWILHPVPGIRGLARILAAMLWVFLMLRAYAGQTYKVPFVGSIAEDVTKRWAERETGDQSKDEQETP